MFGLDQSLVPGYQLESYDLGTLFDEIDAAGAVAGHTGRRRSAGWTGDWRRSAPGTSIATPGGPSEAAVNLAAVSSRGIP